MPQECTLQESISTTTLTKTKTVCFQVCECCSKCLFLVLDTYTLLPQTTAVAYASLRDAGFSKILLLWQTRTASKISIQRYCKSNHWQNQMLFYINSIHFRYHLLILQSGLILILVSLIFDPISFIDFWYNRILLHRNLSICEPFIKILKNRHGCRWSLTSKKPKYVHADKLQKLDKQVLTESLNWCPLLTRCLRGASAMLTRSYVITQVFFWQTTLIDVSERIHWQKWIRRM